MLYILMCVLFFFSGSKSRNACIRYAENGQEKPLCDYDKRSPWHRNQDKNEDVKKRINVPKSDNGKCT